MTRARADEGRAGLGRLLLLAALLLGIVTMHTWGHPSGHSEHGGAPHSAAAPAAHGAPAHSDSAHRDSAHRGSAHGVSATSDPEDVPPGGIDPTMVCLFLLGSAGVGLVGLATLRLTRRRADHTAWSALRRAGPSRRGTRRLRPPPLRIALAELSVLRI